MGACGSKSDDDDGDSPSKNLLYTAAQSSEVGASMVELEAAENFPEKLDQPVIVPGVNGLVTAAANGELGQLQAMVIETDIHVDEVADSGLNTGKTALLAACEGGHVAVVQYLLQARAATSTQSGPNYEGRSRIASTPLLQACYQHIRWGSTKHEVIEALISSRADLNTSGLLGHSPVLLATSHVDERNKDRAERALGVLELLLAAHADPNQEFQQKGCLIARGTTPLLCACNFRMYASSCYRLAPGPICLPQTEPPPSSWLAPNTAPSQH